MDLKYQLSDFYLLSSDDLNMDGKLQTIFHYLLDNDLQIKHEFENVIGLWECKWYNNDSIPGYNKGDFFWLNTQNVSQFIANYALRIKKYADEHIGSNIKLEEFSASDPSIFAEYYNVLTGYNGVESALYEIGNIEDPIQLRVSLIDNNKYSIHDDRYWKSFFVDTQEDIDNIYNIIDERVKANFDEHLSTYHFEGNTNFTRELSALSGEILSSTMDISASFKELPESMYMHYNTDAPGLDQTGLDYVLAYVSRPYPESLSSSIVAEHQSFRLWRSGVLEHYGLISPKRFIVDPLEDAPIVRIPFNWTFIDERGKGGAYALRKGALAKSDNVIEIDESDDSQGIIIGDLPNVIDIWYQDQHPESAGLLKAPTFSSKTYNFSLTPILQSIGGVESDYLSNNVDLVNADVDWNHCKADCVEILWSEISAIPYYSYSARGAIAQ